VIPAASRRTCVGCRRRAHPDDLVRVVATPDAGLERRASGGGRGAWVCPDPACVEAAARRDGFSRTLRRRVDRAAAAALRVELGG